MLRCCARGESTTPHEASTCEEGPSQSGKRKATDAAVSSMGTTVEGSTRSQEPPQATNRWAQISDADEMHALAYGTSNKRAKTEQAKAAKPLTAAQKKLQSTNTKGMKSIASFFKKK